MPKITKSIIKRKALIFIYGTAALFLFIFFSYLVKEDLFTQFDFDTTVRLQDNIGGWANGLFSSFSLVGSFEVAALILLGLLIINKKLRGIFVLPFYAGLHIIELFGKMFVNHPGPPFLFFRYDIPFLFPSSYVQPGSSYPSGHAARTAFLNVILIFMIARSKKLSRNKKIFIYFLIFTFDFIMLVSRVYLGEHWTSDVIGGVLLGVAMGVLSLIFI